ncbi:MAG: MBL fold metallo-hydrolase [Chloroflexi bacterium]|nr:MBL fold metallo-hydrolase [Chloroflexota bacterium]
MRLTVLGCSPAVPNPGGACAGYLLEAGGTRLLVDCGHGVCGPLQRATSLDRLSAVIVSHMHPDHYFDLVPLKYGLLFGGLPRIPLLLPPGGAAILDRLGSAAGLHEHFWEESFDLHEYDPTRTLTDVPSLAIDFAPVKHMVPGYAMLVAAPGEPGRRLFYSADTAPSDAVRDLARGASVALLEATLLAPQPGGEEPGHLTASEAGRLAREAGVHRLLLTHYWHSLADALLSAASAAFGAPAELAMPLRGYDI